MLRRTTGLVVLLGILSRQVLTFNPSSASFTPSLLGVSLPGHQRSGLRIRCCSRTRTSVLMQDGSEDDNKWSSSGIDESKEKLESVKAGGVSLIAGSVAWAPVSLFVSTSFYPSDVFSAQWELAHDGLALMCALFGLVYRYAVRQDQNPQLKQGVVGAFVITRSWAMLQADTACTALPLQCGAPLSYFNWHMIAQGSGAAVESVVAFGAAAAALEFAFARGYVGRFPSS